MTLDAFNARKREKSNFNHYLEAISCIETQGRNMVSTP